MVARIHIKGSYAQLEDDGVWSSPNESWVRLFNLLFGKEKIISSPSAGSSPFANQVRKANEVLGGQVEWAAGMVQWELGQVY